jgi:hypothetical protein
MSNGAMPRVVNGRLVIPTCPCGHWCAYLCIDDDEDGTR